jgi:MFS transporter, DHA3 family, multidrug efflux protein
MKTFHAVLANSLAASLTNMFVWFAVTFWVYLQTKSVLATSIMAGIYSGTVAVTGFFLGTLVDHFPKKRSLLGSSLASLVLYSLACLIYVMSPPELFKNPSSIALWAFIFLTLMGALAGNLRSIALTTLVTILVPEDERDKANGLVGSANGVAFLVCSFLSGLVIGYLGVRWMLLIAIALTVLVLAHLITIPIHEERTAHADDKPASVRDDSRRASRSGVVRPHLLQHVQ